MAGFECACGFNRHGEWFDQIEATGHDVRADEDFRNCRNLGLMTAREGVRWPLVDRGLRYDFSQLAPRVDAAQRYGIELIYDLFHYGYPPDLDPATDAFIERFADYCYEVARFLRARADGPFWFTPVNEPSYYSWAAGHAGLFAPHWCDRGYELKVQVARACIEGINAIRSVLPEARIVHADPLCRVVPATDEEEDVEAARRFNEVAVFESLDMIAGRLRPELGGSAEHLDVVGVNYYWTNQWVHGCPEAPLREADPRCHSLGTLLRTVWDRYHHPIVVTETSHSQPKKAWWLREVAREVQSIRQAGIPLEGVCLYPALGMPEWHDRSVWAHMGLWEVDDNGNRTEHPEMVDALRTAQTITQVRRAFML